MPRLRILIVEDKADIRRLVRWTLEGFDVDIFEASNGLLGLQQALKVQPNLMIVDRMMPGDLDGLQLTAQVRARQQLAGTKILMLTAMAQDKDRELATEAGVDDYLTKPFSPGVLSERVKALLAAVPAEPEATQS